MFLFYSGATFVKRVEMKRYCAQNFIFTVKRFRSTVNNNSEFTYNDFGVFHTSHLSSIHSVADSNLTKSNAYMIFIYNLHLIKVLKNFVS